MISISQLTTSNRIPVIELAAGSITSKKLSGDTKHRVPFYHICARFFRRAIRFAQTDGPRATTAPEPLQPHMIGGFGETNISL